MSAHIARDKKCENTRTKHLLLTVSSDQNFLIRLQRSLIFCVVHTVPNRKKYSQDMSRYVTRSTAAPLAAPLPDKKRKQRVAKTLPLAAATNPEQWRRALAKAITSNQMKHIDACELDKMLDPNVQPRLLSPTAKGSASDSLILLGRLRADCDKCSSAEQDAIRNANRDVVIKIAFATRPEHAHTDRSLEVERNIYVNVTNPLIEARVTPHIMYCLDVLSCDDATRSEFFNRSVRPLLIAAPPDTTKDTFSVRWSVWERLMRSKEFQSKYDLNKMYSLVLERGRGAPLGTLLLERKFSNLFEFVRPILFQIVYTLQCFLDVGLQHKDLHLGNVWIDSYTKPVDTYYWLDANHCYRVRTTHMAKLYDFDRASKVATRYNAATYSNKELLDTYFCEWSGQCSGMQTPQHDLYKVLVALFDKIQKGDGDDLFLLLARAVSEDLLDIGSARCTQGDRCAVFPGFLCVQTDKNDDRCRQIVPRAPDVKILSGDLLPLGANYAMTPLQMLYALLGPEYRVDASTAPRSGPNVYSLLSLAANESVGQRYDEHAKRVANLGLAPEQVPPTASVYDRATSDEFERWLAGKAVKPRVEFGKMLGARKDVTNFVRLLQQLNASQSELASFDFFESLDKKETQAAKRHLYEQWKRKKIPAVTEIHVMPFAESSESDFRVNVDRMLSELRLNRPQIALPLSIFGASTDRVLYVLEESNAISMPQRFEVLAQVMTGSKYSNWNIPLLVSKTFQKMQKSDISQFLVSDNFVNGAIRLYSDDYYRDIRQNVQLVLSEARARLGPQAYADTVQKMLQKASKESDESDNFIRAVQSQSM